MGRLSAIFVAICMVLIACSVGAMLYLRFGLSGAESAIVTLTALTGLALFNAVATRTRDRGDVGGQVVDLSRGTADLARQVGELGRRLAAIESKAQAARESTLASHSMTAEIGEVGGLIKQIAETVAAHDTQLKVLTPGTPTPIPAPLPSPIPAPSASASPVAPPVSAPAVKAPPVIPLAPLVAALPGDDAVPKPAAPAETKAAEIKPADPKPFEIKPFEIKPLDLKPAEAKPAEPAPVEAPPSQPAATGIGGGRFKDTEPAAVIEMIREAVDNNRIDLFLQPIVTLPQRKVRYYEAVARLRAADGEQLMAADFLPYAEAGGLMPKIDNLMLFRCVQVVRRLLAKNREIGVFCNVSASTLVDSDTFSQFTEFMEANKAIAPALVFEFTQAAMRSMGAMENESLAALAERGYRFSLDNVTDLRIEPRDLAERGFRFVKVQASLLLNRSGPATTDIHPADFAGLLARFGVELIAAKIESETAVVDLLDYDVKFGQGFLFSPPRPVRPEVMQGIGDRNDVVVREAGDAPPAPAAPPVTHRVTSLAQLARGLSARN